MVLPVIAIVGRPNVGKSTLFNCLTKTRDALVADQPGVTRDRKYGEGHYEDHRFIVVDTGGIESEDNTEVYSLMAKQSMQAIEEADFVLFVVDAKEGLVPNDMKIADHLRRISKPICVAVNKSENFDNEIAKSDFYQLGFENIFSIAAAHRRGLPPLIEYVVSTFPTETTSEIEEHPNAIKIAFIGRPNVGKSTLVNRILGEERVLVYDQPGTTRDSIYIPFHKAGQDYILIDTAGVRRRTKISEDIEKFSVIKTLQTIEASNVVIFVLNAREGILEQDLRLLDFIIDAGKALVIAINKWDHMSDYDREQIKSEIDRRLGFVSFARKKTISALYGTGVGNLFLAILEAYQSATKKLSTPILTRILQAAVTQHQPPLVRGRRIKLRYAHPGGQNPPLIVIHGNQLDDVPPDYTRYLINLYLKKLKLQGTPIKIEYKASENPYRDRKNPLTPRQRNKKIRMLKYVKRKK